ncbi:biotin transporter BioY [Oryzobacter terrae]|uniref:biotin transporter BioY n=1 Tax=Oryzobacter terrae TaxID=1620385 RepID=UPI00366CA8CD
MHDHSKTRDVALVATFAGLIGALGLIPAFSPFGFPVPVTIQTLGVMLAGAVLGARRGAAAVLLFLALVAAGLPLLSGGRGGLGVFAGPSAGYLIGFPIAAFLIGYLVHRFGTPYRLVFALPSIVFGGIVVLYAIGIPVSAWRAELSLPAAIAGSAWFLVGDWIKAVVAAFVAQAVHRAYPGLLPDRRDQSSTPRATRASASSSA